MPTVFKVLVLLVIFAIFWSLFKALVALVKNEDDGSAVVKGLAWRVGLSAALLVFLGIAQFAGWIKPHGVRPADEVIAKERAEVEQEEQRERKSGGRYREE